MFDMDHESSQMLRRLTELAEENNKILHHMQNKARWGTFFSTIKWILFVAITLGAYVFVQPYIDQTLKFYQSIQGTQVQNQGVLNYLKNLGGPIQPK